ncbi:hypothetical protein LBMAG53_18160 [Planctomycetota bacterium]|nr:hypothetical protein LBMAG53_18160 [Planctomycetota bacterium]
MNILIPAKINYRIALTVAAFRIEYIENNSISITFAATNVRGDEFQKTVKFDSGYLRVSPAYSDREVISRIEYDHSNVPENSSVIEMDNYLKRFQEKWRESGLCPDPNIYFVEQSSWIPTIPAYNQTNINHILLVSEDCYVEILCRKWQIS